MIRWWSQRARKHGNTGRVLFSPGFFMSIWGHSLQANPGSPAMCFKTLLLASTQCLLPKPCSCRCALKGIPFPVRCSWLKSWRTVMVVAETTRSDALGSQGQPSARWHLIDWFLSPCFVGLLPVFFNGLPYMYVLTVFLRGCQSH